MTQTNPNNVNEAEVPLGDDTPRELKMTRIFAAPRDLVFNAWTQPEHLKRWWGPRHFTAPRVEVDLRVGGKLHIDMLGPDGVIYPEVGVFKEIKPPERLVFTDSAIDTAGNPMIETLTTITFEEQGGMTLMKLYVQVLRVTPEALGALSGMEQGWAESFYRLSEYVETM